MTMDQETREKIMRSNERPGLSTATDRVAREIDTFVEAEHEQMANATGIMRRIEDLADRLLGAAPVPDTANGSVPQPMRTGHFGGMLDAHENRDAIYRRMTEGLARIERIL